MFFLLQNLPQKSRVVFPRKRYFVGIMSSSRGREDVQRTRTDHGLGAIRGAQFRQEMLDIELDGVQAEHQALRDLLVGETFGHQLKDLALSLTQRLKGRREWCWERRNSGPGSVAGVSRQVYYTRSSSFSSLSA